MRIGGLGPIGKAFVARWAPVSQNTAALWCRNRVVVEKVEASWPPPPSSWNRSKVTAPRELEVFRPSTSALLVVVGVDVAVGVE